MGDPGIRFGRFISVNGDHGDTFSRKETRILILSLPMGEIFSGFIFCILIFSNNFSCIGYLRSIFNVVRLYFSILVTGNLCEDSLTFKSGFNQFL